jgi:hypothetical protein
MTTKKLFPEKEGKTTMREEGKSTPTSFKTDVDDEFTMVSYSKKKRGAACATTRTRTSNDATSTNLLGTKGLPAATPRRMDSPAPTVTKPAISRSPINTRAQAKTTSTDTALVTLATFAAFHQQVYPIIDKIANDEKYKHYDFVERWKEATTQQINPVTSTAYFRVVLKAFSLSNTDLHGYVNLLKTCPNLEKYLCIFRPLQEATVDSATRS